MDESLQELEEELKRLRPRGPSPDLTARIERELRSPDTAAPEHYAVATSFPSWKWRGWHWQLAAAAAAALVGVFFFWEQPGGVVRQEGPPSPVASARPPQLGLPASSVAAVEPGATSAAAANFYRPVGATNVLYDLKDEGTVYLGDNQPARRVRYRYVDTYTWKNPATRASLKWSVPREEVRVVPVSLN